MNYHQTAKITLVTGGSRGLGRSTALSVARHGGDVILTYQNRVEDAQAVVAEIEALGRKAVVFQLDVGNVAAFAPFADHLKKKLRGWTLPRRNFPGCARIVEPVTGTKRPIGWTSSGKWKRRAPW